MGNMMGEAPCLKTDIFTRYEFLYLKFVKYKVN